MNKNNNHEGERVLVTGGTGFVGPYLVRYLKASASSIAVLGSGSHSDTDPTVEYYSVDIRDRDLVRSLVHRLCPASIYHLAGISSVGDSWANPRLAYEVNVLGTYNVFEAAMSLSSPPKILNISTSQVYAPSRERLTESSLVGPDNPYAATKAMAELLAVQYRHLDNGGIVTARSFNHGGPGQTASFFLSSIAKQFVEMESNSGPPTVAVGNLGVRRDFTDVRDVVHAYGLLLENGELGEIYNVCSGVSVCLTDIIEMFQAQTGIKAIIERDAKRDRSNDVAEICGDPGKLRGRTGWYPAIPLKQTVADLLEYWRSKRFEEQPKRKH
jgi:GDP-4-dehydro-6-deoxy-D-mannose reductase